MNNGYSFKSLSDQKKITKVRLDEFMKNSDVKMLFMPEPVGYGKTKTLIDTCLEKKDDGTFLRSIFLTYSTLKTAELEQDFIEKVKGLDHKPKILRLFGVDFIKNEKESRLPDDIETCPNKNERERYVEDGLSAFSVCDNKCKVNAQCPYYRTVVQAKKFDYDILIGTLAEMQNHFFYFEKKFKFSKINLLVLDEDAVKKCSYSLPLGQTKFIQFVEYLKNEFIEKLTLDEDIDDSMLSNIKIKHSDLLEKLLEFGLSPENGKIDVKILKKNGIKLHVASHARAIQEYEGLREDSKKRLQGAWYNFVTRTFLLESKINLSVEDQQKMIISAFPNLIQVSPKTIIMDATTSLDEVCERFSLTTEDADKLTLSYHPSEHIIVPKGKIYQVVNNVSKTSLFKGENKDFDQEKIRKILNSTRKLCDELNFSDEIWIIGFQELIKNTIFQKMSKDFGFTMDENLYHGAVRGLNQIQNKDLVVIGSNFPRDELLSKQLRNEMSVSVEHAFNDDFLRWKLTDNGAYEGLETLTPQDLKIKGWMDYVSEGHGKFGRKTYLETIVQSMRSRFFWNDTKTLLFSAYPLTDFGIAAHRYITRDEFEKY